jgi:hypothetical protein
VVGPGHPHAHQGCGHGRRFDPGADPQFDVVVGAGALGEHGVLVAGHGILLVGDRTGARETGRP